jgi:hypothetical protein
MKTKAVFDSKVKPSLEIPDFRNQFINHIEAEIEAAHAFASERELYVYWLRHGLASPLEVAALMTAEKGALQ